ncbi:penicillin-binding transpeptidase domain-containing protein [Clostridium botulinum]
MKINEGKSRFTRYTALVVIMILIFTAITSRLFFLQIVKGGEFEEKANNRSVREISDAAPRGNILDKNGCELAVNTQSYVLVYNPTDESNKVIFQTLEKVFKILNENNETIKDDFELKINPFRFEFNVSNGETRKSLEIRFKRDRGFNEDIEKKLYKGKKDKLTKEENDKVNEALLEITPQETFESLIKKYKIDTSKFDLENQRKLMIVLDTMKMQSFSGYKAITISNIKQNTAFNFLQMLNDLPGIEVNTQPIRTYPNGELASGVLGYISKISTDQDKYVEKGYDPTTDYVGASGIEAAFEDRLKGSKGGRIVKLNKQGRIIEELGRREPYPGQTIQLTIDKNVQAAAEKSLDDKMKELRDNPFGQFRSNTSNATRGAAVVLDVRTGAVLALASRPGFDPNWFTETGGLKSDLYKQYFAPDLGEFGKNYVTSRSLTGYYPGKSVDEVVNILFPLDKSIKNNTTIRKDLYDIYPKPFYNYATQSVVPPGSTFKPMTAVAGLESGVITPGFGVMDNGTFDKGGGKITTFILDGPNGYVELNKAIQVSSNPYFMTIGKFLRNTYGDDGLAKYAWKFGLGVDPNSKAKPSTGIEIPERFGQVYNSASAKSITASTYLWKTMEILKSGTDDKGNKFTSIDLYDNSKDSDKVTGLKADIKRAIQEAIKEGSSKFDKSYFDKKLSDLVEADYQYSGKGINTKEIAKIRDTIYYIAVSDANSQLRGGFNMYDACIGQGMDQFTPLQIANYIATLVNGGTRYKVHLVDKFLDPDGKVIKQVKPEVIENTNIKPENLEAVRAGMVAVNEKGTAAGAFGNFPIKTGGKTGTASLGNQEEIGRTDFAEYVGYAPLDNPEIAVCVMIFDGGQGFQAAYVARDIYSAYFNIGNANKATENKATENNANLQEAGDDAKGN